MKRYSNGIIIVLFLLSFINIVNSAEECCYDPNTEKGVRFASLGCEQDSDFMGLPFEDEFCESYEATRVGCEINDICYDTVKGKKIFKLNTGKIFGLESDDTNICTNTPPITDSCSSDLQGISIDNNGPIDSGNNPGTSIITGKPVDPDLNFDQTATSTEILNFCSSAGYPYGFFVTKNSCESIDTGDENNKCLFNPYLGGKVNAKYDDFISKGLDKFENSCIPMSEINECLDYKTKNNCELNPSINVSGGGRLENGCSWIEYSDIFTDTETDASQRYGKSEGICLTNTSFTNFNYYDKNEYSYRLNNIKNPSFEVGINNWVGGDIDKVIRDDFSSDGYYHYELSDGESISQNIYELVNDVSYSFFAYVRADEDDQRELEVTITSYYLNDDNELFGIESSKNEISIVNLNSIDIFNKINFNNYVTTNDVVYVEIKFTARGGTFKIDAVDFEPTAKNGVTISDQFFKPVEIITSKASRCEVCYDPLNLNMCQKEKSDILGDCSYMVSGQGEKYEYDETLFLDENVIDLFNNNVYLNTPWESQSLANSLLFCEMYVNEIQCKSEDNYVNSKYSINHKLAGGNLCRWEIEQGGCFKSSNGDNFKDTEAGYPVLRSPTVFTSIALDDFKLACDTLAPNTYIYLYGKNISGEDQVVTQSSYDQPLGALNIKIEASDVINLEACEDFEFDKILYVDYCVNGDNCWHGSVNSNVLSKDLLLIDFLDGPFGDSLIEDGTNDISIRVLDRSGNVAKDFNYNLNIDIGGPTINLTNPMPIDNEGVINSTILKGKIFEFEIKDNNAVSSCEYELTPRGIVNSSFYTPSGDFDIPENSGEVNYNFPLPIFNSSDQQIRYKLNVTCSDPFLQKTSKLFHFLIDFNTNIVLFSPKPFAGYDFPSGFLNGPTLLDGYSSDKDLQSCVLLFPSQGLVNSTLNTENIVDPDNFQIGVQPMGTFKSIINGTVDFTSNGIKNGIIQCTDSVGNVAYEDLTYYYDTVPPKYLDFEVSNRYNTEDVTRTLELNSVYYSIDNLYNIFNVSIDGTLSWIEGKDRDRAQIRIETENGDTTVIPGIDFDYYLFNDTKIGHLVFNPDITHIGGINPVTGWDEELFYEVKFILDYYDKAGNMNSTEFSYFVDNTILSFDFGSEMGYSENLNTLFVSSDNPSFNIKLNSPSYREFKCGISLKKGALPPYYVDFEWGNELNFNFNEIVVGERLLEGDNWEIKFDCEDIYGIKFGSENDAKLVYDNTPPVINNVYLKGRDAYFRNAQNIVFNDLIDELMFEIGGSGETSPINCFYEFYANNTDEYICTDANDDFEITGTGISSSGPLNIVKGSISQTDAFCERTPQFKAELYEAANLSLRVNTQFAVNAYCVDLAGQSSDVFTLFFDADYLVGNLVDFDIEYRDGFAYAKVSSLDRYEDVYFSFNENSIEEAQALNFVGEVDGLFYYESLSALDLSDLFEGTSDVYAHGVDSGGSIAYTLSNEIFVDFTSPKVELLIPDMQNNNEIYSNEFLINIKAFDTISEISSAKLYVNDELIFDSEDVDYYNPNLTSAHSGGYSIFDSSNKNFSAYVGFIGGEINETYTFRFEAYDKANNLNETEITLTVRDGVSITILEIGNTKVELGGFTWVTKENAPQIKFKTSKVVTSCSIYPLRDSEWGEIYEETGLGLLSLPFDVSDPTYRNTDEFIFDLSYYSQFELSKLSDSNTEILILCGYDGKLYNYTRLISYIDFLPDYVMDSSNGFVFNEEPYETELFVKSVGPYRYITCNYGFNGALTESFGEGLAQTFAAEVNLENLNEGPNTITLECKDILDTVGPKKEYNIMINKNTEINVSDLKLTKGERKFYPDENNDIYVSSLSGLAVNFKVNLKNDISCTYRVVGDGFFNSVINFFKDLFTETRIELDSDSVFEFNGLFVEDLTNEESQLRIECLKDGGEDFISTYNIKYDDSEINMTVVRS